MSTERPTGAAAPLGAPSISVALCTYNGAEFIEEQLCSILGQTHLPAEIVIADDGSNDGTVRIARAVLETPSVERGIRTRYLAPEASGPLRPARNFVRAMNACTSPFIALADQDDVWHPDKLEVCAKALTENPAADLVVSNARLVDSVGAPLGLTIFDTSRFFDHRSASTVPYDPLPRLLRGNFAPGMTFLFRANLLPAAEPFPDGWLHDYWLFLVSAYLGSAVVLPEELVDYRVHESNAVGTRAGARWRLAQRALARWRVLRTALGTTELWRDHRRMWPGAAERLRFLAEVDPSRANLLQAKLAFEQGRLVTNESRLRGVREVAALYMRGDYERFTVYPRATPILDLANALARRR